MSAQHGTKIPTPRTSAEHRDYRESVQLRKRRRDHAAQNDLRNALRDAAPLLSVRRSWVGA